MIIKKACSKAKTPPEIWVLLFAQFSERFGFYGLMSLFVLYLTKVLSFSEKLAYDTLGVFFILSYVLPIVGGLLSNRLLGYRPSIILGGIFLSLGLIGLSTTTVFHYLLYPCLSLIVIGNGLFCPAIMGLMDKIYQKLEMLREGGFTYYQISINSGGVLAPLICGFLAQTFGYRWGFIAAGLGILTGTLIFLFQFKKNFQFAQATENHWSKKWIWFVFFLVITLAFPLSKIFAYKDATTLILYVCGIAAFFYTVKASITQWKEKGKSIISLIPIGILLILFEAMIRLQEGMLTFFAEKHVYKNIGMWEIPTQWFLSIEPLFVILCGGILTKVWLYLNSLPKPVLSSSKFAFSFFAMGSAFGILFLGTFFPDKNLEINPLWLISAYFLQALSELSFMPIALALLTRITPKELLGFMVGTIYLYVGFGSCISTNIAKMTSYLDPQWVDTGRKGLKSYGQIFEGIMLISFLVSLILFLLIPAQNRLYEERKYLIQRENK